jgi:hypothetical protein
MAVPPAMEGAFGLNVSEIVVPFELDDAGDPCGAEGEMRDDTKRSVDFGADTGEQAGRGGWRRDKLELSMPVSVSGGIRRGRFSRFARKTSSIGLGTQCSNWGVVDHAIP